VIEPEFLSSNNHKPVCAESHDHVTCKKRNVSLKLNTPVLFIIVLLLSSYTSCCTVLFITVLLIIVFWWFLTCLIVLFYLQHLSGCIHTCLILLFFYNCSLVVLLHVSLYCFIYNKLLFSGCLITCLVVLFSSLKLRAMLGKSICFFYIVKQRDPCLSNERSVQQSLQLLAFLQLVMEAILSEESLCWVVYNGILQFQH